MLCHTWVRAIGSEIRRVAGHPSTVLITAPSGTGKELVARAVHGHSPRANHLCIPVDCAATAG